jgi:flagellar biosynthesis/type III secretory pathway protein FliH
MVLPEELEVRFQTELARLEEETQMPYITSIERMGIERGLQQGRQEGLQQGEVTVLRRLLSRRFGPLPAWAEERLAQASLQELEQWTDRVLEAPQLDAVFAAG